MLIDDSRARPDERVITIQMTFAKAKRIQGLLADAACWMSGYKSALGADETSRSPIGHEGIREMNIALKNAME